MLSSFGAFVAMTAVVVNLFVPTGSKTVQIMRYNDLPDHITNYNSQTTLCKPVTPPCIICTTPTMYTLHVCSDAPVTFKYGCPERNNCRPEDLCTRPPPTKRKTTACPMCSTTRTTTKCTCTAQASTTTAPSSCSSCRSNFKYCECIK